MIPIFIFIPWFLQAQAQECILEKSMTDSRKSTITAKVAAQIVEFYKTTLKNLETCHSEELISSRRYKVLLITNVLSIFQCALYSVYDSICMSLHCQITDNIVAQLGSNW